MYQGRVELTSNDILEKEFKYDTKGYRPQEVDRFLDTVMSDYNQFNSIINELQDDKKVLSEENLRLKQEIRNLNMKLDALKDTSGNDVTNVDILKRISNLEKIIYGKE